MKQLLFSCFIAVVLLALGCNDETQLMTDQRLIREHLAANNLEAELSPAGFFYRIETPGSDSRPSLQARSRIEIQYKGELLDGTVFDQTLGDTTVVFPLNGLIRGWQQGIPLIGRGGRIHLYLPSFFGYGASGTQGIEPNSVLIFDVSLIDFENQ